MIGSARLAPREWMALAITYAASIGFRLPILGAPPYGDEGGFFYVARHLIALPPNVDDVYGPLWYYPATQFVAERPLYYLLLHLPSRFGFDGYRAGHLVLASLLPVLAVAFLRLQGTKPLAAYGAGAVLAFHPTFVVWGTLALTDTLLAVALLAAFVSRASGRRAAGLALLVAAVWIKEVGILALAAIVAWETWQARHRIRIDRVAQLHLASLPLALLPFVTAKLLGLPGPGTHQAGYGLRLVDQLFVSSWLLFALLAGLAWAASRRWALVGLFYGTFFLGLHVVLERSVEAWYIVPAAAAAVVGVAGVLDRAARQDSLRKAAWAAAALLMAVIVLQVLPPNTHEEARLVRPVSGLRENSLPETYRYEMGRDRELYDAIAALRAGPGRSAFAVDVYGSYVMHPIATSGARVRMGYTDHPGLSQHGTDPWSASIETYNATILAVNSHPLNEALREVYADCATYTSNLYITVNGADCANRSQALVQAYSSRTTS